MVVVRERSRARSAAEAGTSAESSDGRVSADAGADDEARPASRITTAGDDAKLDGRADSDEDAGLARRAAGGDREAFGRLFERWFDRVFDVAWHVVHNRDTAAEVAQETFVVAWLRIGGLRQPESVGGWLLRIARNKALNRLQRERRSRPVGDQETIVTLDVGNTGSDPADPVADRERDDMVWVASAALGDADASLLSLHLRHGLDPSELADELGVQPNAVHQRLFRLRTRLGDAIGAWVLWHRGRPACHTLRAALEEGQGSGFDRTTASTILAHARGCDDCTSSRQLQLRPEALFAAVPLVVAGPLLRARAAAAVEATGTPAGPGNGGTTGKSVEPGTGDAAGPDGGGANGESSGTGGGEAAGELPEQGSGPTFGRANWVRGVAMAAAVVTLVVAGVALASRTGDGVRTDDAVERSAAGFDASADDRREPALAGTGSVTSLGTVAGEVSTTTATSPPATSADGPASSAPEPSTDSTAGTVTTGVPVEPVPPPTIGGFRVSRGQAQCRTPSEIPVVFAWSSTGSSAATLGPTGGAGTDVKPSGTFAACSVAGIEWTLTVTGAGGSTAKTVTVR